MLECPPASQPHSFLLSRSAPMATSESCMTMSSDCAARPASAPPCADALAPELNSSTSARPCAQVFRCALRPCGESAKKSPHTHQCTSCCPACSTSSDQSPWSKCARWVLTWSAQILSCIVLNVQSNGANGHCSLRSARAAALVPAAAS